MQNLYIHTGYGPVGFVGRLGRNPARVAVLVLGGAFPPQAYKHELVDELGHADVLVSTLPGMDSPPLQDLKAATMSAAFDEALDILLPGRRVVAYGISTGAVVTLGMRARQVVHHVAQEPFFGTADLWPFLQDARARMREFPDHPVMLAFLKDLFGITPQGVENRDYGRLIDRLGVRTDVIVGATPLLPPRDLPGWPSFTRAADLERLAAHPHVAIHTGPPGSGHNVERDVLGAGIVRNVLRKAIARAEALGAS